MVANLMEDSLLYKGLPADNPPFQEACISMHFWFDLDLKNQKEGGQGH